MKFKVLKGTALHESISSIMKLRNEAIDESMKLVKELGARTCRPSRWGIGGGIESICFDEAQDLKIWKKMSYGTNEFMPRLNNKAGKEIQAKIDSLPYVTYPDLNGLFGKSSPFWCPSIIDTHDCYLVEIPDQYQSSLSNTDLIEILNSEYFALKEAHEAKKATV